MKNTGLALNGDNTGLYMIGFDLLEHPILGVRLIIDVPIVRALPTRRVTRPRRNLLK